MKIFALLFCLFLSSLGQAQSQPSVQAINACGKDWSQRWFGNSTQYDAVPNSMAACFCDLGVSAWQVVKSGYLFAVDYAHDPSAAADRVMTLIDNPKLVIDGIKESISYRMKIYPKLNEPAQSALVCGAVSEVVTPFLTIGGLIRAFRGTKIVEAAALGSSGAEADAFSAEIPRAEGPQLFTPEPAQAQLPAPVALVEVPRTRVVSQPSQGALVPLAKGTHYGLERLTTQQYDKIPFFTPLIYNEKKHLLKGIGPVDARVIDGRTLYRVDPSYHRPPDRFLAGGLTTIDRPVWNHLYLLTPDEIADLPNLTKLYYWSGKTIYSVTKGIDDIEKSKQVLGFTKYGFPVYEESF